MEPQSDAQRLEPKSTIIPKRICEHGRLIDTILTERGTATGKVCCLECGAVIDDPYHSRR